MKGAADLPPTSPSLLLRIQDPNDAASWAAFLETYAPLVYAYCRRKGLQDSDAADVSQEVMAQVARAVRSFAYQPERGRFRDWLGTITRHKLLDHQRGARRARGRVGQAPEDWEQVAEGDAGGEWEEEFNARILETALARVRPDFEPATWRAFALVWLEHRPAPEAAQALGVPVRVVYVAKSRVLKRLREEVLVLADDLPQSMPLR